MSAKFLSAAAFAISPNHINPHSARRQSDDDVHSFLLSFYYHYLGGGGEARTTGYASQ